MMHKDYKMKRPKPPKTLEYTKRMATFGRSTLHIYLCCCNTLDILMDKLSFNTLNTHVIFLPKGGRVNKFNGPNKLYTKYSTH
jgi:hypothetical protein